MKQFMYFILGIIVGIAAMICAKPLYKKYRATTAVDLTKKVQNVYGVDKAPNIDLSAPISADAYKEFKDPNKPLLKVRVINWDRNTNPENARFLALNLLAEKYALEYSKDDYDILISSYHKHDNVPMKQDNVVSIYYTWEAYVGDPTPYLETTDLVMGFDFIDRPNYIRVPLYYMYMGKKASHDYKRPSSCDPSQKPYFACFLVSNHGDWFPEISDGVYARDSLFYKLSSYKKVMSGGKHLNNMGGVVDWGGDTDKFLAKCKFIIAYENTLKYPGYVTEKAFHAWHGGGIPLYNTHKNGLRDINAKALLYAGDFATEDDFVEYIKKVDNDDKLYCDIWNQQLITDPSKDYEVLKDKIRKKLFELVDQKVKK